MDLKKSQGATIGAVLLAGILFRPTSSGVIRQGSPTSTNLSQSTDASMDISSPGPWIASCKYWAPDRLIGPKSSGDAAPPVTVADHGEVMAQTRYTVELTAGMRAEVYQHRPSEDYQRECSPSDTTRRWGIPTAGPTISVTALIATVPDPAHTHLAMEFDRRIDALLQAASDNGFLTSYYWLPWKHYAGMQRTIAGPIDAEPGHESERESEPGLIILKSGSPKNGHWNVIYVFLVGETPTEGVNGFQLQKAFAYENELEHLPGVRVARGQIDEHMNKHTAIIGPIYTGSASAVRAGIEAAAADPIGDGRFFDINGASLTCKAKESLTGKLSPKGAVITYHSFDQDSEYAKTQFLKRLNSSGYDLRRVALLSEDNTAFGNFGADDSENGDDKGCYEQDLVNWPRKPLVIRFPREISLLRNAESNKGQVESESSSAGLGISPYLHMSLRDSSAQDSVPQFSQENTPLSQEAQLMAIARQLERYRIQFIAIVASTNPLDQIFLAQFLHRARPDARLVFLSADLMMEREIDNVPFIGSLTLTPYSLTALGKLPATADPSEAMRAYPVSNSIAYYNSASYTIWSIFRRGVPMLMSYRNPLASDKEPMNNPPLWVTAIGTDGYYPLAIMSPCASNLVENLPIINREGLTQDTACTTYFATHRIAQDLLNLRSLPVYPSITWLVICTLVGLLCLLHVILVCLASRWSPFTRDLEIRENDQPRRRSTYLWVGTAVLFCMAFVVAYPVFSFMGKLHLDYIDIIFSSAVLGLGAAAIAVAIWKTWGFMGWLKSPPIPYRVNSLREACSQLGANVYLIVNCLAWSTLAVVPILWITCCERQTGISDPGPSKWYSLVGMCFSFRCLHPNSGVCPLVPVLFLLLGWYFWALLQARRLRFTAYGKPCLPNRLSDSAKDLLYVTDDDVNSCDEMPNACLYENISCLFITGRMLRKIRPERRRLAGAIAAVLYVMLLFYLSVFCPIRTLGSFLWNHTLVADPFEMIIGLLFFPLLMVGFAGWLRTILVWTSLKAGVLARLENQPLRFAFDRLQGMGWMAMLRQGGLDQQMSDIARCVESSRQILHQGDLLDTLGEPRRLELDQMQKDLESTAVTVLECVKAQNSVGATKTYSEVASALESKLASFGGKLLEYVLIPYWCERRVGLVESKDAEERPIKARHAQRKSGDQRIPLELHAGISSAEPAYVQVAEEFLAIKYVSLIRAVLANMRYLMTFVSASFVLAIMAWNSYPFQPRHDVNWLFTGLLAILGSGIIWVFAQMHRDPILSRVTETKANELGIDFYFRIVSFGALPILTWLAYQFPAIGNAIFKFLQPGMDVVK